MNRPARISEREQIELLQEHVLQLRAMLGLEISRERRVQLIAAFRLTPHEATLLGVLLNSRLLSKDLALHALVDPGSDDYPEEKILDVYICKLRKRLKPHGIEIRTFWAEGYHLAPAERAKIEAVLEGFPL